MTYKLIYLTLLLILFCNGVIANSKTYLPKNLQLGVLGASQVLREYRGSSQTETKVVPLPYLEYSGDFIKVDRHGARAEFFANNLVELKLSGEASLSGGGTKTEARQGMPELKSAFELGPSLNMNLTGGGFSKGFMLNLPLRSVIVMDLSSIEFIGFTFNPKVTYMFPRFAGGWQTKAQVGLFYGSERYHGYYYDVTKEFETASRPQYQATDGFSGTYFKTSLRRRYDKVFYAFSLRYDNLKGASFIDSPLIETEHYYSFSAAVAYIFDPF